MDAYQREQETNFRAVQNMIGQLPDEDEFKEKIVRVAGAQIPVTTDLEYNKKEIFKALDWAKENEVDQLLTPESALSGYCNQWYNKLEEINSLLKEIEEHQVKCGVALNLGTCFQEPEGFGKINRNQIRHYTKSGILGAITNKTHVLQSEDCIGRDNVKHGLAGIPLIEEEHGRATAIGMLCNDMWGWNEDAHTIRQDDQMRKYPVDLIMHATNGRNFLEDDPQYLPFNNWADGFLRMTAYKTLIPILTGFPAQFIASFFTGSILIETIFSLDGIGLLSYESILHRDYPVVLGTLFLFTLLGLFAKLITDICYLFVDPRIKFDSVDNGKNS